MHLMSICLGVFLATPSRIYHSVQVVKLGPHLPNQKKNRGKKTKKNLKPPSGRKCIFLESKWICCASEGTCGCRQLIVPEFSNVHWDEPKGVIRS